MRCEARAPDLVAAPGDGLLHPIPLVALAVLVLNDHWWKHAAPGALTGKLSDVAGMAFFPLLLQGLSEIARAWAGRAWGPSRRALCVAMIASGAVFGLAKTWTPVNALVRSAASVLREPLRIVRAALLAQPEPATHAVRPALVQDPTDLAALPALLLSWAAGARRTPGRRGPGSERS